MTARAAGNPVAVREGVVTPADLSKDRLQAHGNCRSDNRHTSVTLLGATRFATERAAAFLLRACETPFMSGIFTAIVEAAMPHSLSVLPSAPRNGPGAAPEHVMVAQLARDVFSRPVHAAARKISVVKVTHGCAERAMSGPPNCNDASGAVS